MLVETREIYKCEHCRKVYQIKSACEKHEKFCSKNPKNQRRCNDGCIHLEQVDVSVYLDQKYNGYTQSTEHNYKVLHCKKLQKYLYPLSVERKGNAFNPDDIGDGDKPNEPMPKECEHFDDNFIF